MKLTNYIRILALGIFLIGFYDSSASATLNNANLKIDGNRLSVNLEGSSVRDVIDWFKDERGISFFLVDESLYTNTISVRFSNVTEEQALKRIFSYYDNSIIYDTKGRPIKVYLFTENKESGRTRGEGGNKIAKADIMNKRPSTNLNKELPSGSELGETSEESNDGGSEIPSELKKDFQVIKDINMPGAQTGVPDEIKDKFKIVKNYKFPEQEMKRLPAPLPLKEKLK